MHVNLITSTNNMNATGLNQLDRNHDKLEKYVSKNLVS